MPTACGRWIVSSGYLTPAVSGTLHVRCSWLFDGFGQTADGPITAQNLGIWKPRTSRFHFRIGPPHGEHKLPQRLAAGGITGGIFEVTAQKNNVNQKGMPFVCVPPPLPGFQQPAISFQQAARANKWRVRSRVRSAIISGDGRIELPGESDAIRIHQSLCRFTNPVSIGVRRRRSVIEAGIKRDLYRCRGVFRTQLLDHVRPMNFDGSGTYAERFANLLV